MSAALSSTGSLAGEGGRYIDFGTEPPLTVGQRAGGLPPQRAVSVRWLTGTILTGLTSIVLIGGALVAALNGQNLIAAAPGSEDLAGLIAPLGNGQKGDRFVAPPAAPTTRVVIPVAVTVREGDRELIIQRPYALISASLAAASPEGIEIPDYDPVTIVGEAAEADEVQAPDEAFAGQAGLARGDVDGGNAAVRTSAFPVDEVITAEPDIQTRQVEGIVRANAPLFLDGVFRPGVLSYANAAGIDLGIGGEFVTPDVRMIPENVSFLPKNEDEATEEERIVAFTDGATLEEVLAGAGMSAAAVADAADVMGGLIDITALDTDNRIRIAFAPASQQNRYRVLRISIYENEAHQATVARNDAGQFVRADAPSPIPESTIAPSRPAAAAAPRLYEALYLTGVDQAIPQDQIRELVRIFAFELDMQARIGPSDTVRIFHSASDSPDQAETILYASVTIAGNTYSYYRFQTPDGTVKYYDADGRSADNFLLRKPMNGGEFRSGYGNRLHPVLGVYRLHSGVDWSAPSGTPILAAGDGVIERMEWNSGGYGRFTVIRHANGYETAYAHQVGFAEGLAVGDTVRQGQVIGYVGSTGLSTGNHLHYEVRINGQTVNPLTIRLPQGRVLAGAELAAFQQQRNQVNALIGLSADGTEVAAAR